MSITYNSETLSNKQNSDLDLAKILLSNINSLKPAHFTKTTLDYNGINFKVIQPGFLHSFLIKDIHFAIQNNYENHKNFILDTLQKEVNDYNQSYKSHKEKEEFKTITKLILSYYGFNSDITYPLYSDNVNFQKILTNISNSLAVHKLME